MSRVEEYIENYTKRCSNQVIHSIGEVIIDMEYTPWLTPDHARAVAEIAREEVIEKTVEWLDEHMVGWNQDFINNFRKYMEEKI